MWEQEDVPVTVHAFVQKGVELSAPASKRQCIEGSSGVAALSGSSADASCLAFYVRMADHAGKFDIEAAKSFALVPRLHYAALKRGETVTASECPPPHPSFSSRAHIFCRISVLCS